MKVEVTAKDIATGERKKSYCCPIALALCRASGRPKGAVNVDVEYASLGLDLYVRLPIEAREFICAFDSGERVEPLTFEVKTATEAQPVG